MMTAEGVGPGGKERGGGRERAEGEGEEGVEGVPHLTSTYECSDDAVQCSLNAF